LAKSRFLLAAFPEVIATITHEDWGAIRSNDYDEGVAVSGVDFHFHGIGVMPFTAAEQTFESMATA